MCKLAEPNQSDCPTQARLATSNSRTAVYTAIRFLEEGWLDIITLFLWQENADLDQIFHCYSKTPFSINLWDSNYKDKDKTVGKVRFELVGGI